MQVRDVAQAVAVGALVAAVVIAMAFAGGLLIGSPPTQSAAPAAPAYDADKLVAQPIADGGTITAPAGDESKTVVVDISHGNAISENSIQPLVDALVAAGHEVQLYSGSSGGFGTESGAAFNKTLRGADALVVANPATTYSSNEVAGVEAFANAGGRVLLAADPPMTTTSTSTISIIGSSTSVSASGQPTNLASAFGVSFGNGYLYDMAENANNFQAVYASGSGGVADGVENAVLLDATPVTIGGDASSVLAADVSLSSTRANGSYTVAARSGNVLAVGDTDFLTAGTATAGDNDVLVSNVAAFLVTGDKRPGVPTSNQSTGQSPGSGSPPVVTA